MTILDQHGRPFEKAKIADRGGKAYSFKAQEHWQRSVATGIDPSRLAAILKQNDQGDNLDMLTLAIEMEERDLHYYSQLETRANAIAFVPLRVETSRADRKNKRAKAIAEACQEHLIDTAIFRWLILDLMDAIGKGYSVIQPLWDTTTRPWTYREFLHVDQRYFQYDKTGDELRIRKEGVEDGLPLPAGVFLTHHPRIRSGVKLRGGIARLAAVNWFFKTTTITDWLAFAEVYGMPLRIGHYNSVTSTEDEIASLAQALVNLGHDASAMVPDGMKIEVLDARRPPSGDNLYSGLARYFDEQTSRAVLGQVLASDARATGLGTAIADLHRDVRQDIREADSLAIRHSLEYLIRLWVQLNYGADAAVPRLVIDIEPPTDIQKFTQGVLPWFVQGGMEFDEEWLYRKLQVKQPEPGAKTLKAPLAPGTPGAGAPIPGTKSVKKTSAQK